MIIGNTCRWRRLWKRNRDIIDASLLVSSCEPPTPFWAPVPPSAYYLHAPKGEFGFAYLLRDHAMERVIDDHTFQSMILTHRVCKQTRPQQAISINEVLSPAAYFETEKEAVLFRLMF